MIAMRMVQVPVDQLVDVIPMRYRLMPATGAMDVTGLVPCALVVGRAAIRIALRHLDHVLVDVIAMRVMQVPVVKIVDVIAVAYGGVTAARAMLVRMVLMMGLIAVRHGWPPFDGGQRCGS